MCKLDAEAPLYYRFVLQNHSFRVFFWLLHIADLDNFQITKVEAHEKYFEQKIPVVLILYRRKSGFTSSMCCFDKQDCFETDEGYFQ